MDLAANFLLSACPKITRLLWNTEVHYCVPKISLMDPILSHFSSLPSFPTYLFKINFISRLPNDFSCRGFLRCDAVQCCGSIPTFQSSMLPLTWASQPKYLDLKH